LGAYLVDVSEALEIVHLERAELVLYGVEDVGDRHAELLRLDAVEVDVDVEGGQVDLVAGEARPQLRRLLRGGDGAA
jgi:hypothetical protein